MSDRCEHPDFAANVDVGRLTDVDGGKVTAFAAEVTIKCAVCGLPFIFICPDVGTLPDRPTCSVDSTEMRLPIAPSDRPDMRSAFGYRINVAGLVTRKDA